MSAAERIDRAPEIRRVLVDIRRLCGALGLLDGARRQPRGVSVCCPVHGETHPSCSVTIGGDRTVRVKCFSCGWGGDALHLIAAVRGLDLARDFTRVLEEAAAIAGLSLEGLDRQAPAPYVPPKALAPDTRTYPLRSEVGSLWARTVSVTAHPGVRAWLKSRGLDPERVCRLKLARALPEGLNLPRWAWYRGEAERARPWPELGYAIVFPVYDETCTMRSVRAGRITPGPGPKRLPPAGHLSAGLLLANQAALAFFGHGALAELLVVEGEPDFLTWALATADEPRMVGVVGVGSGFWSRAFAAKVARGTRVVFRTHEDDAGAAYAFEIGKTIARRAVMHKAAREGLGDENDRACQGRLAERFDANVEPLVTDSVDLASFELGRLLLEFDWVGEEIEPGVFAARCPNEALHPGGVRFDGATALVVGERGGARLTCSHDVCRGTFERFDKVANCVRRMARAEGL